MAHPSKFVSANLNKSYGHPSSTSSSFGNGRPRSMVVLSRPRSSGSSMVGQKTPQKVSVPPPMNLPSLRKEHERFNPSSIPGSASRPGSSGPGSSTMGWTKPNKDGGTPTIGSGSKLIGQLERAVLLRGEEFPLLRATVASGNASGQKLKQKHPEEGEAEPQRPLDMRPHIRSSSILTNGPLERNEVSNRQPTIAVKSRKPGGSFPGLFPLAPLSHTSDWADDERDTALGIPERGFSRTTHDIEGGSVPPREFPRGDLFGRDLSSTVKDGRDSSSWRAPQAKDGSGSRDFGFDGDRMGAKSSPLRKQMSKESDNGQGQSTHKGGAWNSYSNGGGSQDGQYHRKDLGYGNNVHNGRNMEATFNGRAFDHNMRGGDTFQNRPMSKGPFSSGDKGHPLNDPVLNFGREKRSISNGGKQYVEVPGLDITDPFSGAPIGEVNIKVFKKKDMLKQVAFYDPVRESFEAELERIQRMQELERQRVSEEQARASELSRREHEERERLIREEEERRRRFEEQARESAWRAEQEKLDAAKRIEEQKNAREDEKRRIVLEEDRRKEAARKKLLDLEARIAKRQAEVSFMDTKLTSAGDASGSGKERDVLRGSDVGDWEDGERMVESITNTAASDTSSLNKFFDAGSRPHSSRDHSSSFMDRGTHANNWRREVYDHENSSMFLLQNQESDHHSSRRGAFNSGINLSKKEAHGNIVPSLRPSSGETSKPSPRANDLRHARGNRWNIGGDGDYFNKNSDFDAEFIDDDKFCDITWGNGRSHRSSHAPYTESSYQNYEVDGFSSFERSRHSLRQPRVLPPPSISSMTKSSIGPATLRPSSPSFLDCEMRYQHDRNPDEGSYDRVYNENLQQPGVTGSLAENRVPSEQINDKNSQRCESQSSLSVSSSPASPTHLSHDELDESESSQLLATSAMEEQTVLTQDKHVVSASEVVRGDIIVSSSSDSHGEDEWAAESHELIHEQDVYDEYDDEYRDEEEAHEGSGENLGTSQEFEDIQSDVLDTTDEVDQVVSGFDEGDEVRIPHNDEFENICRSSKMTVGVQSGSVGATQELIRSGGIGMDTENAFTEGTVNEFSRKINETEKALQGLVLDPVLSTSYPPDATGSLGTSVQHPVLTGLISTIPSTSSVQPIRPSISTVRSQSELPVKLQFGLFSGPPLIPCPVPTIQIGSIQMPLHPHPQVGPIAQIHPSQPSFFQFGQLRYPSPISQGIFPLTPLSMSFVQAPSPSNYFLNQNHEGSANNQVSQESSFLNNSEDEVVSASVPIDKLVVKPVGPAQDTIEGRKINLLPDYRGNQAASQSQTSSSSFGGLKKSRHGLASQSDHYGFPDGTMKRNYRSNLNNKEPPLHSELNSSQFFSGEKALGNGSNDPGTVSGIRGKRFAYPARNAGSRPFFPGAEASYTDLSGFRRRSRRNIRRMEFRVREGFGRIQNDSYSFNDFGQDGKLNHNLNAVGNSARYRGKKDVVPSKSTRITIEAQNINYAARNSREVVFDDMIDKASEKDASSKKRTSFVGNSYESYVEKDYDDAPLQNGVVRVFKQPGIEAPSDEDDFIQVRSKRQMLNDRREQREKEIKAKSRGVKMARKIHAVPRSNVDTYLPNKAVAPLVAPSVADAFKSIRSNPNIANVNHFTNVEVSHVFVGNVASQSLPPIGTPAINLDSGTNSGRLKSSERRSMSAISSNFVSGLSFDNNASFPLGSWDNADINQKVMALTQSELDESMQSTLFDSHAVSSISHESNEPVTSIATPEKTFMPSASPLDSLLAREKIQFGAVTSPTILPPGSRTVSNGIGPLGSGRSEVVMSPKLPTVENDFTVFFDQEKCPDKPCTHIEDPETEVAASAVAVAAISNNEEIVGNRLGAGPIPLSDTKNFSAPVATLPDSGGSVMAAVQEVAGQSTSEVSLTVSLPADLLVDSSSLPLWQPLPGPQSSSGTMLSHFPAAPSSHFPFFEMNPMLGGPLFAFGPHEGSPGTQDQAQRSATLGSGPLGAWPQCHPAMESFYIPQAGFAGPFIGPDGIPGGQGPHMVVYNHFNPVGRYGQVGLGFMGTTFIPSVKQPDWKHNPVSPVVGVGEGEIVNINVISGRRNSPIIPAPIRHFAPGSSNVPTASPPLAMFDMTPFQSSADLPLQARWSHIPAPPIHSVLLPVQQHDGIPSSQFTRVVPVDTPTGNYWFKEPRLSKAADGNRNISVPKDASTQFLNEPCQVEPLTSRTDGVQKHGPYSSPSSGNDNNNKGFNHPNSSMVNSGKFTVGQSFKPQPHQKPTPSGQQYLHPVGYSGRSQSSGPSKNFASSKVKQVYVAKSHASGRAATG